MFFLFFIFHYDSVLVYVFIDLCEVYFFECYPLLKLVFSEVAIKVVFRFFLIFDDITILFRILNVFSKMPQKLHSINAIFVNFSNKIV